MKAVGLLSCVIPSVVLALAAPVVEISAVVEGDEIHVGLSWGPIDGATQYNVYSIPDPTSLPLFLTKTPGLNYDFTVPTELNEHDQPEALGIFFVTAEQIWNSGTDFSDQQGFNGWHYGYTEGGSDFQLMTEFFDGVWFADSANFWTLIASDFMHPNGTTTSGGMIPVLQQCVLRWVSPIQGTVQCDGHVARGNIGGNGTEWIIEQNGEWVSSQYLGPDDVDGFDYNMDLDVVPGDTIDFIVDPYNGHDLYDSTVYGVTIRSQ